MDPGQNWSMIQETVKLQLYATSGESEIAWKEGKIII